MEQKLLNTPQAKMHNVIYEWIKNNYGESEADDPSWDISALSAELAKHVYELHDDIEKQYARDDVEQVAEQYGISLTDEQLATITDSWMFSDARTNLDIDDILFYINSELDLERQKKV